MSECNARQAPAGMRCARPEDHDGPHTDHEGHEWSTPDCPMPAFVDWESRAEKAEATVERVQTLLNRWRMEEDHRYPARSRFMFIGELNDALRGESE